MKSVQFENMAVNTDMLRDEARVTKLTKKVFEDMNLKNRSKT